MPNVSYEPGALLIDGKKTQIISGTIHYFRVPRELWRDRLQKAKQCGLNSIETYFCWNLHEPAEGVWDFSGNLDFEAFLEEVAALGLYAIVRPGPYICAEWDNGGLPPYLSTKPNIRFRCLNEPYLAALTRYYEQVLPRLVKLQHTHGGPVIAVQLENEYGSYGQDKDYLRYIRKLHLDAGIDVVLFTSDGAGDFFMQGGTLPECMMTLNFGSKGPDNFAIGHTFRQDGPDFCMEFWNGWFDHWGEEHHTRDAADAAQALDEMLRAGASVNFYMFHGGTNFGLTNGANCLSEKGFEPTVTSYDYDAALTEAGDPSPKFFAFQEVIRKYRPDAEFGTPAPSRKLAYGKVKLAESAALFDNLDRLTARHRTAMPETMEYFGQNFGFIHYRHFQPGPLAENDLTLPRVHDRAIIFIDGQYRATLYRNEERQSIRLTVPPEGCLIDILVENMGRTNYGPLVGKDQKGLPDGALFWLQAMAGWDTWALELNDLTNLKFGPFRQAANQPAFHRGYFEVAEAADTFLEFPGIKGVAYVNGRNLGRYWNIGPGNTLYVPGVWLKPGRNELIVFELHELNGGEATLTDAPNLG